MASRKRCTTAGKMKRNIDCWTREFVGWNLSHRCRTEDALVAVEQAVLARLPEGSREARVTLTTENGTQFTSSRFLETLGRLGITHRRTAYRHPEGNSSIERFHRSLKEEEVRTAEDRSLQEARASIARWSEEYNHDRPHRGVGNRTPHEAFMAFAPLPGPDRLNWRGVIQNAFYGLYWKTDLRMGTQSFKLELAFFVGAGIPDLSCINGPVFRDYETRARIGDQAGSG
jgi:hypothetical protein